MAYKKLTDKNLVEQNVDLWNKIDVLENVKMIKMRSIVPIFLKYIKKQDKIIEAGCGPGGWVYFMQELGYKNIIGVDNNPAILDRGKELKVQLENDDILNSKFTDNSFDIYISLGVIEHSEIGPGAALLEAKRIVKKNGIVFISTPLNNPLRLLVNHPIRDLINIFKKIKGKKLYFSEYRFWKRELINHIQNAGFEVLEVVPNDYSLTQSDYSLGFYTDWPIFRHSKEKYRLNKVGSMVHALLKRLSVDLVVSGYLVVGRNKK